MIARAGRPLSRLEQVFVLLARAAEILDEEIDNTTHPWKRKQATGLRVVLENQLEEIEPDVRFRR